MNRRNAPARTYMYTPFANHDGLMSALGENMARLQNGKAAHGLLAPSHRKADRLEALRQHHLAQWGASVHAAQTTLNNDWQRRLDADAHVLARIRQVTDLPVGRGTAAQRMTLKGRRVREHRDEVGMIDIDKMIAQGQLAADQPRLAALQQTRILNTTANRRQFPGLPLLHLRQQDKLYVLGHGTADHNAIHATPNVNSRHLTAPALARHLRDAGMPRTFHDLRLTACQGVPPIQNTAAQRGRFANSNYVVPSLFRATRQLFPNMRVTGYAGNGVTFPYDSAHHQRTDINNNPALVRRSNVRVTYR